MITWPINSIALNLLTASWSTLPSLFRALKSRSKWLPLPLPNIHLIPEINDASLFNRNCSMKSLKMERRKSRRRTRINLATWMSYRGSCLMFKPLTSLRRPRMLTSTPGNSIPSSRRSRRQSFLPSSMVRMVHSKISLNKRSQMT